MSTNGANRKAEIITVALTLAKKKGYLSLRRNEIAQQAGVADGSIAYYFGTMDGLQEAVIARAVETEVLEVIAQAIVNKHKVVVDISAALRKRALAAMATAA